MEGTRFEKDYLIHYYETGRNQELSINALMCYFEEMALLQSEAGKVGIDYYLEHQVAWMLTQFDIQIHKPVCFPQTLKIVTQPSGYFRFLGYRDFFVFNPMGEQAITARSAWIFVNTENKRPTKVHDPITIAYGLPLNADTKKEFEPLPQFTLSHHEKEFQVRHSDIDFNKHVNNVKYVEWALEALPLDLHENLRLTRIQIAFKKETHYGMRIRSQVEIQKNEQHTLCIHRILDNQDNEACVLATYWE